MGSTTLVLQIGTELGWLAMLPIPQQVDPGTPLIISQPSDARINTPSHSCPCPLF